MNRKRMDSRNFNKPKNRKYTIKRLGDYLIQFKWWLIVALILTIATNLFSLIGPLLSGYAIGAIEPGVGAVDFNNVYKYAILLIGFYTLSSILSFILSILMIKISKIISVIKMHLISLPCRAWCIFYTSPFVFNTNAK